jgi:hypothetical protein
MFQSLNKIIKDSADSIAQTATVASAAAKAKLDEMKAQPSTGNNAEQKPSSEAMPEDASSSKTMDSVDLRDEKEIAGSGANAESKSSIFSAAGKLLDSFVHGQCANCGDQFNIIVNYSYHCRMCNQTFCPKCLEMSKFPIPNRLLFKYKDEKEEKEESTPTEGKESTTPVSSATKEKELKPRYLCKAKCLPEATIYCMNLFRSNMEEKFYPILSNYLESHSQYHDYFPIESISSPKDTSYRQTLRIVQVVEQVSNYVGWGTVIKTMKYAYYSSELYKLLISSDIYLVLEPLMENLKGYGIDGPTALLNLYYLCCKHQLEYKQFRYQTSYYRKKIAFRNITPEMNVKTGILSYDCPYEVIDYVSRYVSAAQWLYNSYLPAPHNGNEWSSWALSRQVSRQKWSVLMCINETTKLPNGNKCPAFALLARNNSCLENNGGEQGEDWNSSSNSSNTNSNNNIHKKAGTGDDEGERKEALLIIRGSSSTLDWSINFQESLELYSYQYYDFTDNEVKTVDGHAHSGFLLSMRTILHDYNLKTYLMKLYENGFNIKVIGHSLGAGVSALVAAELRNIIMQSIPPSSPTKFFPVGQSNKSPTSSNNNRSYEMIHRISAVVYCSPAIISEKLANAFLKDRLLINVINGHDVIPRYNKKTMQLLANELKEFSVVANEWMIEDKMDLIDYAWSMGRASDIHYLSTEERRLERYQRVKTLREKKEKKAQKNATIAPAPTPATTTVAQPVMATAVPVVSTGAGGPPVPPPKPKRNSVTVAEPSPKSPAPVAGGMTTVSINEGPGVDERDNVVTPPPATNPSTTSSAAATAASYWGIASKSIASTISSLQQKASKTPNDSVHGLPEGGVDCQPSAPPLPHPDTDGDNEISLILEPAVPPRNITVDSGKAPALPVTPVSPTTSSPEETEITLAMVPGPIVHIYEDVNGMKKAAVINHHHELFQSIQLLNPTRLLQEHQMKTYRSSIDALKHSMNIMKQEKESMKTKKLMGKQPHHLHRSNSVEERVAMESTFEDVSEVFPKDVGKSLHYQELPYLIHHSEKKPELQPLLARSDSVKLVQSGLGSPFLKETTLVAESVKDEPLEVVAMMAEEEEEQAKEEEQQEMKDSFFQKIYKTWTPWSGGSKTTADKKDEKDSLEMSKMGPNVVDIYKEQLQLPTEEDISWMPCGVCGLDVTWPYIMHSDASRATSTHNCR